MSHLSFLAVPNIVGMRLGRYIQIFGIVLLFGVCLFFLLYFLLLYREKQSVRHQLDDFDHQAQDLGKQLLITKVHTASGKSKLILFIEYLEKFVTNKSYANVSELLLSQGFSPQEVEACEHVLYANTQLPQSIDHHIDIYFIS